MYPNVEAELARARMTKRMLSEQMGITQGTLSLKLSGKSDLTFPEALKIKRLLRVDIPIEELFKEENRECITCVKQRLPP